MDQSTSLSCQAGTTATPSHPTFPRAPRILAETPPSAPGFGCDAHLPFRPHYSPATEGKGLVGVRATRRGPGRCVTGLVPLLKAAEAAAEPVVRSLRGPGAGGPGSAVTPRTCASPDPPAPLAARGHVWRGSAVIGRRVRGRGRGEALRPRPGSPRRRHVPAAGPGRAPPLPRRSAHAGPRGPRPGRGAGEDPAGDRGAGAEPGARRDQR